MLSNLKEIILSTRPWSFTAAIIPVLITSAVTKSRFSYELLIALAMAISIQAAANLTNTYYDFINGIDSKKIGERTLVDKKLSPWFLLILSFIFYIFGISLMLPYLLVDDGRQLVTIFSLGIVLAYFYTATPVGLKYIALGDLTIFLCFGPLLMQCTSLILIGRIHYELFYYSIPIGLLTEAILHANNSRDIESDLHAGITTIAGLIGYENSKFIYSILIIGAYISTIMIAVFYHYGCILTLVSLPLGIDLLNKFSSNNLQSLDAETAKFHLPFGLLMWIGILMTSDGFLGLEFDYLKNLISIT